MATDPNQKAPITTPAAQHQKVADDVAANLSQILGSDVTPAQVIPTTAESPVNPTLNRLGGRLGVPEKDMDQFQDIANRMVLDKPGIEPSSSFLRKLLTRVKKKNPDSDVSLVKK